MKNIAFIPIRKGSKGIPGKNTKLLGNRPLFCWILDTLIKCKLFDEVWLATDCDEAISLSMNRYGQKVNIYKRSQASATDESPVIDVIKEFIKIRMPKECDWLCLFQATSPFTTAEEIRKLILAIESNVFDSIVSCTRIKKFRWDEKGTPLDYELEKKPHRQEYKGLLVESGAFYASRIQSLRLSPYILSGKIGIIELNNYSHIEIDEPLDWDITEYIAKTFQEKI